MSNIDNFKVKLKWLTDQLQLHKLETMCMAKLVNYNNHDKAVKNTLIYV